MVVPEGYTADILYRWGDPCVAGAPEFATDASQGWEAQEVQSGDNHDGINFFPFPGTDGSSRGILAMNHEYINPEYFFAVTGSEDWFHPEVAANTKKMLAGHGVSVIEVRKASDGKWSYVKNSAYNRRITGYTPITLSGPAAGHDLLKTAADSTGTEALGTLNNCGAGQTPWGTYITCEENFNGYFGTTSGVDGRDAVGDLLADDDRHAEIMRQPVMRVLVIGGVERHGTGQPGHVVVPP